MVNGEGLAARIPAVEAQIWGEDFPVACSGGRAAREAWRASTTVVSRATLRQQGPPAFQVFARRERFMSPNRDDGVTGPLEARYESAPKASSPR